MFPRLLVHEAGGSRPAYGCLFAERSESGILKVLNRASSGKLSAALAETNPTTAAAGFRHESLVMLTPGVVHRVMEE